jgi:MFS family permease
MNARSDQLSTAHKLALLATLYIAQGLPFGFFTQTLPAVMRQQGYRLASISYTALLTAPWALKFLWAPWVDRYPTPTPTVRARRKRWILACQLAATLAFIALAIHGRIDELTPLFVGFALLNVISATQDIATDGFAVDLLVGRERGYANGVQVAGYRAGMVASGGLLLVVLERIGACAAFSILAVATVVLSVPLLFTTEAPPRLDEDEAPHRHLTAPHFLRLRGIAPILAVVLTYKLAESLASGVLKPFLIDRHFTLADIGAVNGVFGSLGGLFGALSGGALASLLSRRSALIGAAIFQSLTVFLFAFAAAHPVSHDGMKVICFVEAFASSQATATLFTVMMDWCRPLVGATDYTVQASAVVIATGVATLVSGRLAELLGYVRFFGVAGAIGVGSVIVLVAFYPTTPPTDRRTAAS